MKLFSTALWAICLCALLVASGCDNMDTAAGGTASASAAYISGPEAVRPSSTCGFSVVGASSAQWINPAGSFVVVAGGNSVSADLKAPATEGEYYIRANTSAGIIGRIIKVSEGAPKSCSVYY